MEIFSIDILLYGQLLRTMTQDNLISNLIFPNKTTSVANNSPTKPTSLAHFFVLSPQGKMCITVGGAKRNLRIGISQPDKR
ncbi:MAG: hypothetical protein LBU34_07870 [Planctomycetaceae bacterium]|nr:hypothetical protein [Planctomycetaceae bacterium]